MSRLLARIMLAIFMLPVGGMVFTCVVVLGDRLLRSGAYSSSRETEVFALAGLFTWLVMGGYWTALWGASIRWNWQRISYTLASIAACGIVSLLIGLALDSVERGFGTFVGAVCAPLSWLIVTTFIWRESAAERRERISPDTRAPISCPTCGYNLTGLKSTQCPECGSLFTLDELLASQSTVEPSLE